MAEAREKAVTMATPVGKHPSAARNARASARLRQRISRKTRGLWLTTWVADQSIGGPVERVGVAEVRLAVGAVARFLHYGEHRRLEGRRARDAGIGGVALEQFRHEEARGARFHRPVGNQQRARAGIEKTAPYQGIIALITSLFLMDRILEKACSTPR